MASLVHTAQPGDDVTPIRLSESLRSFPKAPDHAQGAVDAPASIHSSDMSDIGMFHCIAVLRLRLEAQSAVCRATDARSAH